MTFTQRLLTVTAIAGILAAPGATGLRAAEISSQLSMKPLQGIGFEVEARHAVSYFSANKGTCELVLTLADEPNWDDVPKLLTTRFEAWIPAGQTTRFKSSPGKSLEFACEAGAQTMSVRALDLLAYTGGG